MMPATAAVDLAKNALATVALAAFELAKSALATVCSKFANTFFYGHTIYLATGTLDPLDQTIKQIAQDCFEKLNEDQKNRVYDKVGELAKMQDPSIGGITWGKDHAQDDPQRLIKALHRLGLLNHNPDLRIKVPCLSFYVGEGGLGSQYFSLGEKLGHDPAIGRISCVNGMGVSSIEHAGKDAVALSNNLAQGFNLHCIYNSTHQKAMIDPKGFIADVFRMKAVNGGSYTRTSYLIAQQWIDFLTTNPDKYYLHIASSEGSAHTNAALRLIAACAPHLLAKIRIINLCPAYFIVPETYAQGLQVMNFVQKEDKIINPWGTGTDQIYKNLPHVVIVAYTPGNDPHNHTLQVYADATKPYVDKFLESGNLY